MIEQANASHSIRIWIGGNYADAQRSCREFCRDHPFCVTVTPTEYIYTGGQESGVVVGIINYPRFPRDPQSLLNAARKLAEKLMQDLCQQSVSIEEPMFTHWISIRQDDSPSMRS